MDVQKVLDEVKDMVDVAHAQTAVIDSAIVAHKRTAETLEVIANRSADEKALVSAEELLTAMAQEMRAKTAELEAALKANTPDAHNEGPQHGGDVGDDVESTTATPAASDDPAHDEPAASDTGEPVPDAGAGEKIAAEESAKDGA